jgi:hypothetical protein
MYVAAEMKRAAAIWGRVLTPSRDVARSANLPPTSPTHTQRLPVVTPIPEA